MMTNLPEKNESMSNEMKEEIRQKLIEYRRKRKNPSLSKLANQFGKKDISEATLSQMLNSNWDLISPEMWRLVASRVSNTVDDVFETSDLKAVHRALDFAREHKLMVGIVGDTGNGKTTALQAYANDEEKKVYYVSCDKSVKPKQLISAILNVMGIAYDASIYEMINRIAKELNTVESPLLIIDEAGKLNHLQILYLHELRDKTNKNAGIALAGMPYFKKNLEKFSNKQKEGYAEFLRRINMWHTLKGLSRAEIKAICEQHGITDADTIEDMLQHKRFADLNNEILLKHITS